MEKHYKLKRSKNNGQEENWSGVEMCYADPRSNLKKNNYIWFELDGNFPSTHEYIRKHMFTAVTEKK